MSQAERNQTTSFTNSRPYSYHSEYNKSQGSEENIYYIRVFLKTRFVKLGLNTAHISITNSYPKLNKNVNVHVLSLRNEYLKVQPYCMNDFQLSKGQYLKYLNIDGARSKEGKHLVGDIVFMLRLECETLHSVFHTVFCKIHVFNFILVVLVTTPSQ